MARDFESFIVDPDLLDPSIDATNLRTTTDTRQELLSDVPEFSGIEFDPTQKNYISDLYALYSGQLPSAPAPAVTTPVATTPSPTAGGGSGDGGQATNFDPVSTPIDTGGGVTNVNTPLTQMITNPVTGQTQTVKQAMTSNQAYTTPTPSSPFLASGAAGGANLPSTSSQAPYGINPTTGQPYQTPRTIADQNAVLGQTFNDQQDPSFWENAKNNFIQTGEDIGGFFANLGNQGIDLGQLAGTTILNLAGKALTGVPLLGTAASLVGAALPPRDPRQTALEELYDVENGTIQSGLMQGYNPVSGNPLNPTFGLQDAYQDRIDTIEDTLADKYNMTAAEIADVKAGSYTGDVDTDLLDRLNQLEEAKQTEKDRLDLFSGDIQETGDASVAEQIAEADRLGVSGNIGVEGEDADRFTTTTTPTTTSTGVNPFEDIDTGVGEFDTAPVTGVTQPGTGTVLGLPGIDRFDDAETSIDMFQDATTPDLELENQYEDEDRFTGGPPSVLGQPGIDRFDDAETDVDLSMPEGASKTGTPVDALNPINRQQHFDNTQKLKQAITDGKITNEEYNVLSAFDANKTMGLGPVTGTLSSAAYQGAQTGAGILRETLGLNPAFAGDQSIAEAAGDTARNIQGVSGNVSPELQVRYQEIISGEDIYRDPILGMVEPPAPMTLADDTINKMTDDVDLDLFDTTPQDIPTSTFDADTFDDDVSFDDFDDFDDGTMTGIAGTMDDVLGPMHQQHLAHQHQRHHQVYPVAETIVLHQVHHPQLHKV
jgi:hypothetical protein